MKMPTTVGICIFVYLENFTLSWAEQEKGFITSGQVCKIDAWILGFVG